MSLHCPKCGGDTHVKETRGNERRRWCRDFNCDGRLTTVEVPTAEVQLAARIMKLVRSADGGH